MRVQLTNIGVAIQRLLHFAFRCMVPVEGNEPSNPEDFKSLRSALAYTGKTKPTRLSGVGVLLNFASGYSPWAPSITHRPALRLSDKEQYEYSDKFFIARTDYRPSAKMSSTKNGNNLLG